MRDLVYKTRRGLRGRAEADRSVGGNAYDYDVVKSENDKGKRKIIAVRGEVIQRVSRMNCEEDWVIQAVPDQRIIDQEIWDTVKAKLGIINKVSKSVIMNPRRPKNLFSYLIKC